MNEQRHCPLRNPSSQSAAYFFFSLFFISLLPFFTLLLRQLIMEDNKAPEVPMPCTAGCGFYGNKIYNNMCSKCFREQAEQNKQRKRLISMYM